MEHSHTDLDYPLEFENAIPRFAYEYSLGSFPSLPSLNVELD